MCRYGSIMRESARSNILTDPTEESILEENEAIDTALKTCYLSSDFLQIRNFSENWDAIQYRLLQYKLTTAGHV